MSRELRVSLPADAEGAREAAVLVRALLSDAEGTDSLACELAVAEASANVVRHAHGADVFTLVARARRGTFIAVVCHLGSFDGARTAKMPLPDVESGRGLALIFACMDRVRHVALGGEHRVVMARRLTPVSLIATVSHSHPEQEKSS